MKNTKGSSSENPEANRQESANKTVKKNPSRQRDVVKQPSKPEHRIINIMMAELSKHISDDIQGDIFCLQAMSTKYDGHPEEYPLIIYKYT